MPNGETKRHFRLRLMFTVCFLPALLLAMVGGIALFTYGNDAQTRQFDSAAGLELPMWFWHTGMVCPDTSGWDLTGETWYLTQSNGFSLSRPLSYELYGDTEINGAACGVALYCHRDRQARVWYGDEPAALYRGIPMTWSDETLPIRPAQVREGMALRFRLRDNAYVLGVYLKAPDAADASTRAAVYGIALEQLTDYAESIIDAGI